MSATRTQIYLTAQQRARIDDVVSAEGVTMAEVIRRALDSYLADAEPDPSRVLSQTFGASVEASTPDRDEWVRG